MKWVNYKERKPPAAGVYHTKGDGRKFADYFDGQDFALITSQFEIYLWLDENI